MSAGDGIAAAIGDNPARALWVIYALWGALFGTAVLCLAAVILAVYGLETVGYFFIGLLAAGLLFAGGYVIFSGMLYRAFRRLARIFFRRGKAM